MRETVITLAAAAVSAVLAIIASKLLVNRRHQQAQAVMAVVLFLAFTAIAQALYQNSMTCLLSMSKMRACCSRLRW